jgi:acyl carrier protein
VTTDELHVIAMSVSQLGKVPAVGPDDDFYDAGFSSINALDLLLDLESSFGVSIPDDEFIVARTPRALHELIGRLRQEQPV